MSQVNTLQETVCSGVSWQSLRCGGLSTVNTYSKLTIHDVTADYCPVCNFTAQGAWCSCGNTVAFGTDALVMEKMVGIQ